MRIDPDVCYALVSTISPKDKEDLINLGSTSKLLRNAVLPVLFSSVHWPHPSQCTSTELLFFPSVLWAYIRHVRLLWPEHWPEASPQPKWGDRFYPGGDYHPRHLDKLVNAIPDMPRLKTFEIACPFFPPTSLLNALIRSSSLRTLSIIETPMYLPMIPSVPPTFHLETLTIVPVAEALRIGEGPFDAKYAEHGYYRREFRRKYRHDILARNAAEALLLQVGKAEHLCSVQVSVEHCPPDLFVLHHWPVLETLFLTGHYHNYAHAEVEILDIIACMPRLTELRLLFAKSKNQPLVRIVPRQHDKNSTSPDRDVPTTSRGNSPALLAQLTRLALSDACSFSGVLAYASLVRLERLALVAVADHPRVPVALSSEEVHGVLDDMDAGVALQQQREGGGERKLRHLRIMLEDRLTPYLCACISARCPKLEVLEIERCGYSDDSPSPTDGGATSVSNPSASPFSCRPSQEDPYVHALLPLWPTLHTLRICIPIVLPSFSPSSCSSPTLFSRNQLQSPDPSPSNPYRQLYARLLASHFPALQRVGLEYRRQAGHKTHHFVDAWLEFDIVRVGGEVNLRQLPPSWYPFSEMWMPVEAQDNVL